MNINDIKDLCEFVWDTHGGCGKSGYVCSTCPLETVGNRENIKLRGELEVVKECEHDWGNYDMYYYTFNSIRIIKTCNICDLTVGKTVSTKVLDDIIKD